jgi:polygalacturonase
MMKRFIAILVICLLSVSPIVADSLTSRISSKLAGSNDDIWRQANRIVESIKQTNFLKKDYFITDFGAIGDGKSDARPAIMTAIDKCSKEGGGRVIIPSGEWFVKGPINLKSNVNLHLEKNATVKFSTNPDDYLPVVLTRFEGVELMNYSPLIYTYGQINVAITGEGILDGQADSDHWWPWRGLKDETSRGGYLTQIAEYGGWQEGMPEQSVARERLFEQAENGVPVSERVYGKGSYLRPNFIEFYNCNRILVQGITVKNSPMWVNHPVLSQNIVYDGVKVVSHGPNNDGLDPESSKNIFIENCLFDTGDDCIAIKSGRNADGRRINVPSENVVIRNCTMKDGHGGVVIGSEMTGGVRNVYTEDCYMNSPNLDRVLRIKTNAVRGGFVENVNMRNVEVGQVNDAVVLIDFYYEEGANGDFLPVVKNINVRNVKSNNSKYGLYLRGFNNSPIRDVTIEDCIFSNVSKGNIIEAVENLYLKDVVIGNEEYDDVIINKTLNNINYETPFYEYK